MPIGNMLAAFGNRPSIMQEVEAQKANQMQNSLAQYRLNSAIRDEQKQNRLSEIYGRYASGDKGALDEMATVSPEWHMQIQKNLMDMEKGQREQLAAQLEETGRMAMVADTPDKWSQMFPELPFEQRGALLARASATKGVFEAIQKQEEQAYTQFKDDRAYNLDIMQFGETRRHNRASENKAGTSFSVGPDGTVTYSEGGAIGLQKPTLNKIEEKQFNATEALSRLNTIHNSFKPEFATFGGRGEALFTGLKDKAGIKLSKSEATNLREFSTYRRDAISHLNRTLNELSGAAVSPAEAERLKAELPDPGTGLFDGDGPTEFKAKADASTRAMKQAAIRYHYSKRSGMDPFSIDLADVDKLMDQRGSELEAQISSQNPGMDPVTIDAMVKDQLSREFGI